MKRKIVLAIFGLLTGFMAEAQLYSTQKGKVSFFSKTPMENIDAECQSVLCVLNANTRELAFSIVNTDFKFQNKLMEEHFNEKYIESEKFPKSTFKGKIVENVDLSKNGEYKVNVSGKLNLHGVELERTIPGTVVVKDGNIQLISSFPVKNADHRIEIPTIVTSKIAESIDVSVDVVLSPKK